MLDNLNLLGAALRPESGVRQSFTDLQQPNLHWSGRVSQTYNNPICTGQLEAHTNAYLQQVGHHCC